MMDNEEHVERVLSIRGLSKSLAETLIDAHNLEVDVSRHPEQGKLLVRGPFSHVNCLAIEASATCYGR